MTTVIAIIGALAVASIPLMLGWRRTSGEAQMVSAMGLKQPEKRFNPEKWAPPDRHRTDLQSDCAGRVAVGRGRLHRRNPPWVSSHPCSLPRPVACFTSVSWWESVRTFA